MNLEPWLAAWSDAAAWRLLRGVLTGQWLHQIIRRAHGPAAVENMPRGFALATQPRR
ncbi:MAG: hypothetical protein KGN16_14200 [Burkholderiales bacterium]|nr:hypothetical protein [Burkholderiales bacterium]